MSGRARCARCWRTPPPPTANTRCAAGPWRSAGVLTKARSGELVCPLPVGLVYDPAGRVTLDPDQGVRDAVSHLFATFTRTGSARATVKACTAEGVAFPSRVQTGSNKGALAWLPLRHHRVLQVLHNPRYAGAFTYGRRRQRRGLDGRTRYALQPREAWTALIPDAHPGYISWQTYEDNQRRLAEAAQARGEAALVVLVGLPADVA